MGSKKIITKVTEVEDADGAVTITDYPLEDDVLENIDWNKIGKVYDTPFDIKVISNGEDEIVFRVKPVDN